MKVELSKHEIEMILNWYEMMADEAPSDWPDADNKRLAMRLRSVIE